MNDSVNHKRSQQLCCDPRMDGTSLTGVKLYDLPKPFFQLLLDALDTRTRHRLRCVCRDALTLVDEFCTVSLCIRGKDVSPIRIKAYARLSEGISRLCVAECVKDGLFRESIRVQNAFSRVSHLVSNYRYVVGTHMSVPGLVWRYA